MRMCRPYCLGLTLTIDLKFDVHENSEEMFISGNVIVGTRAEATSRPQTPPSHKEKWFGEPSRIFGANTRFCNSVT